ncbi:hypothetical protein C4D60_Mb09t10940 [Musa balbisiana]|uniref:Uncharacterized protein n=1 Tax=Musa balbisiana TaxID=52838 RepID=A0A4S8IFK0_MUSBA|nr:hypothetical protein C4D60_Mb09t10940 [Musa balbisiana]
MAQDVCLCQGMLQESLVRVEDTSALGYQLVVACVECPEAPWIHLHESDGVVGFADRPQLRQVVLVECGIDVGGRGLAGEVVEPVVEGCAVRDPDQRENAPDRTTRSFTLNPLDANIEINVVMLAVGGGSCLVSLAMDTKPSLRPVGTGQ